MQVDHLLNDDTWSPLPSATTTVYSPTASTSASSAWGSPVMGTRSPPTQSRSSSPPLSAGIQSPGATKRRKLLDDEHTSPSSASGKVHRRRRSSAASAGRGGGRHSRNTSTASAGSNGFANHQAHKIPPVPPLPLPPHPDALGSPADMALTPRPSTWTSTILSEAGGISAALSFSDDSMRRLRFVLGWLMVSSCPSLSA